MSGRDHARSLGNARDGHGLAADIHLLERALRKGVGRHDRARRRLEIVGMKARHQIMQRVGDLVASSGSPITPVEEVKTCSGGTPTACAVASAITSTSRDATRAGEGVGVARIDEDRETVPRLVGQVRQLVLAIEHRRRTRGGAREHPGQRAPRCDIDEHQIGAPGIADAGLGLCSAAHRQWRDFRKRRRRERGHHRCLLGLCLGLLAGLR
jgi:hypothetical protein